MTDRTNTTGDPTEDKWPRYMLQVRRVENPGRRLKMHPEQRARALLAAVATGIFAIGIPAHAAAPLAKTQPPGFYRMMLGDFEITALSDGTIALPVDKLLTNTSPDKVN